MIDKHTQALNKIDELQRRIRLLEQDAKIQEAIKTEIDLIETEQEDLDFLDSLEDSMEDY